MAAVRCRSPLIFSYAAWFRRWPGRSGRFEMMRANSGSFAPGPRNAHVNVIHHHRLTGLDVDIHAPVAAAEIVQLRMRLRLVVAERLERGGHFALDAVVEALDGVGAQRFALAVAVEAQVGEHVGAQRRPRRRVLRSRCWPQAGAATAGHTSSERQAGTAAIACTWRLRCAIAALIQKMGDSRVIERRPARGSFSEPRVAAGSIATFAGSGARARVLTGHSPAFS